MKYFSTRDKSKKYSFKDVFLRGLAPDGGLFVPESIKKFNKNDLMKFRNFGKKSLTELEELVNVKGLSFGMDLSKYKLDKD